MKITYEEIYSHVLPALESKKTEFEVYQYKTVSEKDIWNFCITKKWRKKVVPEMALYQIVNDILSISPAEFMTFEQIEKFKTSNWFSEVNQEELQLLLNHKKHDE
ncbi:post-transcriptional regulator [Psychrobacillus sp. FJAT-51614]|uniref:Post-transcriptional regulator n=1 Tax=Psychrobacillus mangrovi TaxID=3117745 RepID=A0ABU8F355_9BACI